MRRYVWGILSERERNEYRRKGSLSVDLSTRKIGHGTIFYGIERDEIDWFKFFDLNPWEGNHYTHMKYDRGAFSDVPYTILPTIDYGYVRIENMCEVDLITVDEEFREDILHRIQQVYKAEIVGENQFIRVYKKRPGEFQEAIKTISI